MQFTRAVRLLLLSLVVLSASHVTARSTKLVLTEEGWKAPLSPPSPSAAPSLVSRANAGDESAVVRLVSSASRAALGQHSPLLSNAALFDALDSSNPRIAARAQDALNCSVCTSLVTLLEPYVFNNATQQTLEQIAVGVCQAIKPLCTTPDACAAVCAGIVSEHSDEFFLILSRLATPIAVCAALKQCPAPPKPTPSTAIPVPSDLSNLSGEIAWPSWDVTKGTGTFVHLSDVHIDELYTPGSNADCGFPICWSVDTSQNSGSFNRASNGAPSDPSSAAGLYGNMHCDSPELLIQSLLDHIASMDPLPDFLLYTGDDPAHDVWSQSRASNLAAMRAWKQLANASLGSLGVPVFHTLGNHESFPVNQFEGPGFDSWLYDAAVESWAPFLPADAQRTMQYGGYYQARVRPGLRVVSLNSNYFTNDNFWLLVNQTAAYEQLNWFGDVLRQAAARSEKMIVICHAPIIKWNSDIAQAFLKIVEPLQTTIVNYFMGHTHLNQYATLRNAAGQPMHVAYIGGSVVPYSSLNPGYMLYHYSRDAVSAQSDYRVLVQEAHAYWLDLPQANANNDTSSWGALRYNMSAALGVATLDAASLANLAPQFVTNAGLYDAYVNAMFKGVAQTAPTPQAVQCQTSSNTDAEYHACMHKQGMSEQRIKETNSIEDKC